MNIVLIVLNRSSIRLPYKFPCIILWAIFMVSLKVQFDDGEKIV